MAKAIPVLLFLVGLINFIPVMGVISAQRLSDAYAIELLGNDLTILMRHRALLFGVLGGFIFYSVFVPGYRSAAMVMAGISMLGFLFFMLHEGGYNAALYKVMVADIVGIVLLAVAVVLHLMS